MKTSRVLVPVLAFICAIAMAFATEGSRTLTNNISVVTAAGCVKYDNAVANCNFSGSQICNVTPPTGMGSQFWQYSGSTPACSLELKRN